MLTNSKLCGVNPKVLLVCFNVRHLKKAASSAVRHMCKRSLCESELIHVGVTLPYKATKITQ